MKLARAHSGSVLLPAAFSGRINMPQNMPRLSLEQHEARGGLGSTWGRPWVQVSLL